MLRNLLNLNLFITILLLASVGVLASIPVIYILQQVSFDGLYGQDPYAYHDFSEQLLTFLKDGTFPEPFFWPWGYPGLLALGKSLGLPSISINIILFALLPSLMFLIAKEFGYSKWAGAVAATSVVSCGQIVQSSALIMSDIPAVFWSLLSLLFLLKYKNKEGLSNLVLSGIFLSCSAITRWVYLLLVIPWALSLLTAKFSIKDIVKSAILPLIIILSQIVLSHNEKFDAFDHHFFDNWTLAHFSGDTLQGAEGVVNVQESNLIFYSEPVTDDFWLPQMFLPLCILGLLYLLFNKNVSSLILILPWIFIPYLFFCGLPVQNPRYSLMFFPAIAILVGEGANFSFRLLSKKTAAGFVILSLALLGSYLNLKNNVPQIIDFLRILNKDKESAEWISNNIDRTGTIYAFGITLTLQHYYPEIKTLELFFENPSSLSRQTKAHYPNYLAINTADIDKQWANTPLAESFAWLRDRPGITLIGTKNNYSLFRIND